MSTLSEAGIEMKAVKKFQFHTMRRKGIPDYFARRRSPERVMPPTQLQCSIECVETSQPASQPASTGQPEQPHPPRSSQGQAATHGQASQPASQPAQGQPEQPHPPRSSQGPGGHPRPGRQPASLPAVSHESPRIHLARTRGAAATYTYSL